MNPSGKSLSRPPPRPRTKSPPARADIVKGHPWPTGWGLWGSGERLGGRWGPRSSCLSPLPSFPHQAWDLRSNANQQLGGLSSLPCRVPGEQVCFPPHLPQEPSEMRKKSQTHISKHTGCDSIPESRPHSRFLPGRQVGEYFPLPTTSAKPNKHTAPAGRPEVGELGPRATQLEASADQSQPALRSPGGRTLSLVLKARCPASELGAILGLSIPAEMWDNCKSNQNATTFPRLPHSLPHWSDF